jgi:transposase
MRNGKRIFSTAFKVWLVEQANKPDVSVAGLALKHGVNANQLRHWMRLQHLQEPTRLPAVLPVTISDLPAQSAPESSTGAIAAIEIELSGAIVRVPAGVDERQLRTVLQALRRGISHSIANC